MELPFRSKNPYSSQLYKIFDFETSENIAGTIDLANQVAKKWKKKSFEECREELQYSFAKSKWN